MEDIRDIDEPWEVSADNPDVWESCVTWLKHFLAKCTCVMNEGDPPEPMMDALRRMYEKDPDKWWVGHHFFWGMWMRNAMRSHGYGEKELGVGNLDDYYIELVEKAIKR